MKKAVLFSTEYKGYKLGYVADVDGMADITVRKKGATKMMVGRIIQMSEEDLRKWFKQWVDGAEYESNISD